MHSTSPWRRALLVAGTAAGATLALAIPPTSAAPAPSPATRLPVLADVGHPAGATALGATKTTQAVSLAVALVPRDEAGLAAFNQAVVDPSSKQYRHFLTAAQYNDRFAPSAQSVTTVRDWLAGEGLQVTGVSGNRQVVDATGSPAAVHRALGVTINSYRLPSGAGIYAADGRASAPAAVAPLIRSINGLTNRTAAAHAGSGPSGGESPSDLQTAYSMGSVYSSYKGNGTTVGLLEFDGFKQSDINAWTQHYNLSAITPTVRNVDGGASLGSGQIEVTLDIDSVAVYAPKAAQIVYEAPNTDGAWTDEFNAIASDNRIDILSGSWLLGESCESSPIAASHDAVNQMTAQGVTFVSASGDWGAYGCGYNGDNSTMQADYPASDPGVTGVGGTTLNQGSGGSYQSESVWNTGSTGSTRSGGTYSSVFARPSFQDGVVTQNHRAVPDVADAANPNAGGLSIYLNGSWEPVGGTSEAAPLWGGFLADAVQKTGQRLGNINAKIYQIAQSSKYSSDFHDTTQGSNGYYSAKTGYDLATGWGTPKGDALFADLTGGSTPPSNDFSIAVSPTSGSVKAGKSTTTRVTTAVTTGDAENISLSASGLPTGATATFDPTSINGAGNSTLTVATKATTPNGSYPISVTGTSDDATHSATYTLKVTGGRTGGGNNDVANGDFETGSLSGWNHTGTATVVHNPVHGGSNAASVGPNGDSTLSQTFTATHTTLSLYYQQACAGQNAFGFTTITLTDASTGQQQMLAQTFCGQTSGWVKATGSLVSGHQFTISVHNQDFGSSGTTARTYLDDVTDAGSSAATLALAPAARFAATRR